MRLLTRRIGAYRVHKAHIQLTGVSHGAYGYKRHMAACPGGFGVGPCQFRGLGLGVGVSALVLTPRHDKVFRPCDQAS